MVKTFALFPLQLVVFPGEQLNLHIFEERYRQLVADVEDNNITFLVSTMMAGKMQSTATEVTLEEVANRYPSGECDIRTRGGDVYLLEDYYKTMPGKFYPGGEGSKLEIDYAEDPEMNEEIVDLVKTIYRQLRVSKEVKSVAEGFLTYDVGHYVGLTLKGEYELLTLREARPRQRFLLDHLKDILPNVEENTGIRDRAELNGHFKELIPPNF
ncbi:peptidase [Neolewinella antarctica]|uniref:Peptidase n=1 Tax=Neolewinella antarctica TaxID=442734 RepID=A0ABX0X8C9_9BACT|nr:peptidase [Neolewinella antarctica]NJC25082.1 hypothetical protein [Neolewinella antarctica]